MELIQNHTLAELGNDGARLAARAITRAHDEGREATVLLAAAPSQIPVLESLAKADCHSSPVRYFHMDEYVGLPTDAPQAFGRWLEDNYFALLPDGSPYAFERIDTAGEPSAAAMDYADRLPAADFDLVLCGIGVNGHLAFNDPGTDFSDPDPVRLIELAEASRTQQVDEGLFPDLTAVPRHAITITVPRMLAARTIVCSVLGTAKAEAMRSMLESAVTNEVPATALKNHPDVTVLADLEALSRVA
ncbi:6-phosphogluconolactonase [Georgenia sp. Z1344]|uniref:6-phosphogluconolactonase n=1 Tax=Georgenia sp. Z1344 TaxID=3416706 RepID=UPI003CE71543